MLNDDGLDAVNAATTKRDGASSAAAEATTRTNLRPKILSQNIISTKANQSLVIPRNVQ
jgi:hypothetical protein